MTREIALHCMKSASELERELCEECPIYGQTGCDHCYEDALQYVIGMLEQEPPTKNDLGVDCISRKAVLDAIDSKAWEFCDYLINKGRNDEQKPVSHFADNLRECVREELPSVTPQEPRKGHWINKQRLFDSCSAECSSCHKRSNGYVFDNGFSLERKYYDFCPNCGAKMVEPQESEDNK